MVLYLSPGPYRPGPGLGHPGLPPSLGPVQDDVVHQSIGLGARHVPQCSLPGMFTPGNVHSRDTAATGPAPALISAMTPAAPAALMM